MLFVNILCSGLSEYWSENQQGRYKNYSITIPGEGLKMFRL